VHTPKAFPEELPTVCMRAIAVLALSALSSAVLLEVLSAA
jgi:hypothetical protein